MSNTIASTIGCSLGSITQGNAINLIRDGFTNTAKGKQAVHRGAMMAVQFLWFLDKNGEHMLNSDVLARPIRDAKRLNGEELKSDLLALVRWAEEFFPLKWNDKKGSFKLSGSLPDSEQEWLDVLTKANATPFWKFQKVQVKKPRAEESILNGAARELAYRVLCGETTIEELFGGEEAVKLEETIRLLVGNFVKDKELSSAAAGYLATKVN